MALLCLALVATGCGSTATTGDGGTGGASCAVGNLNLVEPDVLTVATGEPAFPPWVSGNDPSSGQGFESAVAYAIGRRLGFRDDDVKWVRTSLEDALLPGPKNFDFALEQYAITEELEEQIDFSDHYYTVKQAVVAFRESPVGDAATLADLRAFRLGAIAASPSLGYIEDMIRPDVKAEAFETNAAAATALAEGRVDALVYDLPTAHFLSEVELPEVDIVARLGPVGEEPALFGLLFSPNNPLLDCTNDALAALAGDGTLAALEEQWLALDGSIPIIAGQE